MCSYRHLILILVLMLLLFIPGSNSWAQEVSENIQQVDADMERLGKVEETIGLLKAGKIIREPTDIARKAESQLKNLLRRCRDLPLRDQIEEDIRQAQEILAEHNFKIANFYLQRPHTKGAELRLLEIANKYPDYSRRDEVLFLLGNLYSESERPDEAANYLRKLICAYPGSTYISSAFERLNQMGVVWEGCDNENSLRIPCLSDSDGARHLC